MLKKSLLASALCVKVALALFALSWSPATAVTNDDQDAGYWPEPPCYPGEPCWGGS